MKIFEGIWKNIKVSSEISKLQWICGMKLALIPKQGQLLTHACVNDFGRHVHHEAWRKQGVVMKTVVVIEDDVNSLRLYEKTLRHLDYRVYATTTVHGELTLFQHHDVDICVSDIRVGQTNPTLFLQQLKA
jgi:hypothetical protein